MNISQLKKKAVWVRRQILEMIVAAGKGHIGGAFSCTDILMVLYYADVLRFKPHHPDWPGRDRLIFSKGHSVVALYAILADLGFFKVSELMTFCQNGSMLGGHPDRNIPGIEADTGSLGHGLGIACGLALSAKMDKKDFLSVVLLGDGECYEGSVWEAALFAGHHRLNNLIAVIDRNMQCVTSFTEECNRLEPLEDKWRSFGWDTVVIDGHSYKDLIRIFKGFRNRKSHKPIVVIARTIKGKGVSFMEGKLEWHHALPCGTQLAIARQELDSK